MQETAVENMRSANREDITALRKEKRATNLKQHRVLLSEIGSKSSNLTSEQFKDILTKVKQKKYSIDVLNLMKNNCYISNNADIFFKTVGALDSLINILTGKDAILQLEAAACITNLACSSHKASLRISKAAGAYLILFINSQSSYLQDQCAWAAGNIANDCIDCYKVLKAQGLLSSLNSALKVSSSEHLISLIYALHASSKYNDPDFLSVFTSETINNLLKIYGDKSVCMKTRIEAAFVVANAYHISIEQNVKIEDTSVDTIVRYLYEQVHNFDFEVSHPLIRCLSSLSVSDAVCERLYRSDKFSYIVEIIFRKESFIRNETLMILTNILVCCNDFNFSFLLPYIRSFLYPGNPCVEQVLYFLCILVVKHPLECKLMFEQIDNNAQMESLLKCGVQEIEDASSTFVHLLKTNSNSW